MRGRPEMEEGGKEEVWLCLSWLGRWRRSRKKEIMRL